MLGFRRPLTERASARLHLGYALKLLYRAACDLHTRRDVSYTKAAEKLAGAGFCCSEKLLQGDTVYIPLVLQ